MFRFISVVYFFMVVSFSAIADINTEVSKYQATMDAYTQSVATAAMARIRQALPDNIQTKLNWGEIEEAAFFSLRGQIASEHLKQWDPIYRVLRQERESGGRTMHEEIETHPFMSNIARNELTPRREYILKGEKYQGELAGAFISELLSHYPEVQQLLADFKTIYPTQDALPPMRWDGKRNKFYPMDDTPRDK